MTGQRVAAVERVQVREIAVGPYILRIADAEHLVGMLVELPLGVYKVVDGKQKVARYLHIGAEREYVALQAPAYARHIRALGGVVELEARAQYEVVLVTVAQQWIVGCYLVDEVVGAGRQVYVRHIEWSPDVARRVPARRPFVVPAHGRHDARVFRALLIIDRHVELRGRLDAAFETFAQERDLELGEHHGGIHAVFHEAVVDESLEIAVQRLI